MSATHVSRTFPGTRSFLGRRAPAVHAVQDVTLEIAAGETLGCVGESGCGKSTLARMIAGLDHPTAGRIIIDGQEITGVDAPHRKALARTVQYVFQDPISSLNPRKTIRQSLEAPLIHLLNLSAAEREKKLAEVMELVHLRPEFLERYPHEFSGGQAQRIGIARALMVRPKVLVLDEPVSALDVSVQAQILTVLADIKQHYGLTYLFISHDLSVIEAISDRVMVMYFGAVVETAPVEQLFATPKHPYTHLLLNSIPTLDRPKTAQTAPFALDQMAPADLPDPLDPPKGCAFASRCAHVMDTCRQQRPSLTSQPTADGQVHGVRCFLHGADRSLD